MPHTCLHCGYDLHGLPKHHRCPECGRHFGGNAPIWRSVRPKRAFVGLLAIPHTVYFFSLFSSGWRSWSLVVKLLVGLSLLAALGALAWCIGRMWRLYRRGQVVVAARDALYLRVRIGGTERIPWTEITRVTSSKEPLRAHLFLKELAWVRDLSDVFHNSADVERFVTICNQRIVACRGVAEAAPAPALPDAAADVR